MSRKDRLSGNEAVSEALRQINPDVMAAFPITPSTEIPQYFSKLVANGLVDSEFVPVESEHSAMSAVIGAELVRLLPHHQPVWRLCGKNFILQLQTDCRAFLLL